MKQKTSSIMLFLLGILTLTMFITCQKEAEELKKPPEENTYSYMRIDDVTINTSSDLRDGEKIPLDFTVSQVVYNPLITENTQIAFNLQLMDSIKYVRVSTSGVNPFNSGVTFHKYYTTKYFSNGQTWQAKVYAKASLGAQATIIPNVNYNQLNVGNPHLYIKIDRSRRQEQYFDHWCGIYKNRTFYKEYAEEDSVGTWTIDADRCNVPAFSYQFIF